MPSKAIALHLDPAIESLGPEGYQLEVAADRVEFRAAGEAGLFYACQTFRQLLPAAVPAGPARRGDGVAVPCVRVEDRPRFPWRGLMLDCARQFLDKKFLERCIDMLALHKMNRLHLHLTDDEAWTLEIRRYPELTDIRRWPVIANRRRGVYRQEDIRELVAFAASRHVMLVPEIESPSHNVIPATVLREKILCRNNPYVSANKPTKDAEALPWLEPCAAKPEAMEFYRNVS